MTGITISIDRGGTFTDCIGNRGSGDPKDDYIIKLLSVDPNNYPDSNLEGIRRILEHFKNEEIPRNMPIDTSKIKYLRLGTTVATNALLERKGSKCVLITTKGFKDVLVIGNQSRPHIFDLSITKPGKIYDSVIEIDERVTLEDYTEDPMNKSSIPNGHDLVKGISGEIVRIIKRPNIEEIQSMLQIIFNQGIKSIAICLMHSYTFPNHELIVEKIAKEIGFTNISLSSTLSPMIKYVNRVNSSIVDAYLTPEIKNYLKSFQSGLKYGLKNSENINGINCQFMQSDGGLVDYSNFSGLKAILSGPAGGVVGYSRTCYNPKNPIPLIGFDMGGTSTDISRFGNNGKFDHVFESSISGIIIQSPQLDINTIAAGGGSILSFKNGLFKVGPESASSHPGPSCYRKGGPLTITDANLLLGRLIPEYFPKIFGPNENETLDYDIVLKNFKSLTNEVNDSHTNLMTKTPQEIAYGFIEVACENMARPIRQLTEAKGHIISSHRLVSFGGAGGQCAVQVASILGIKEVLIHRYSSILSAYGISLADVVEEIQEPCLMEYNYNNLFELNRRMDILKVKIIGKLENQGFNDANIEIEEYLNLRYQGTESSIMVPNENNGDYLKTFKDMHLREFGFLFDNKSILVDDIRIRASGKVNKRFEENVDSQLSYLGQNNGFINPDPNRSKFIKEIYWKVNDELKSLPTEIYRLEDLAVGTVIDGPAIIADGTQTNIIPPNAVVTVLKTHLFIQIGENKVNNNIQNINMKSDVDIKQSISEITIEPVLLSIFANRFMDIAEQMGTSLQKTSVSVNVKERLDFSCALFDSNGNLVANAPHLPVHLGSMSACISTQAKLWNGKLKPGDILVSNHPSAGGTHLPDITVITPAFNNDKIIFYVASRAHHADIGGLLPGSMPPNSKQLWQEGATIFSEFLVKDGKFQEEKIIDKLLNEPSRFPGCSGTRRLSDNLSDLKAQIAANQKGIQLISLLVKEFGLDTINAYMIAIQDNAAETVTKMINELIEKNNNKELNCIDYMDDGSQIALSIYRGEQTGKVIFDFEGTSPQTFNNFNAPSAITYSAIIYCLRCMVNEEIPLNQGCLKPIEVKIPKNSLLSPSDGCAVVGGNVCTSQRITDTILKAFDIMADSQGCCNNFTFGNGGNGPDGKYVQGFGYYETIAGGHGASRNWDGVSGIHTNMTNTRITDAEIFERRYPIILREFSIRKGSGGKGKRNGGDGVIRDIEFRIPVTASILSERRVIAPHGIHGGEDGARGINLWIKTTKDSEGKTEEKIFNLGGRSSVDVASGDRIVIMTPGGGGWGIYGDHDDSDHNTTKLFEKKTWSKIGGGSLENRKRQQFEN